MVFLFNTEKWWVIVTACFRYTVASLVTDIVPSLKFAGSALRDATVEDVLSHRTGLVGNRTRRCDLLVIAPLPWR